MIYTKFTSLAVALLLALEVTVAQPHGKRQHRRSPKAEAIAEAIPEAIPEPEPEAFAEAFAEAEAEPEVVYETVTVYVDQYGNVIDAPKAAPAAAAAPEAKAVDSSTLAATGSTSKAVSGSGPGVVYSPYTSAGACKTASEVSSDIAKLSGFSMIRLYGTDCNQVANVLAAVKSSNIKLFLGVYHISAYASEIATIVAAMKNNWDLVDTISIGNEVVNSGGSAADVVAAIAASRPLLTAAGYTGPVVTVDTLVAIVANPVLCENSDYIAANCHPFFDQNVAPSGAGSFLTVQGANVKKVCPGKSLLITETGWPHQGTGHGVATVSSADQATALKSMWTAMGQAIVILTAFDDLWKSDNGATYGSEKYWGIQDLSMF